MENLKSIFLNVVASFVYAVIVWWWRNRERTQSRELPPTQPQPVPLKPDASDYDWRATNRQKTQTAILDFLFYFATFAALYYSIGMPPLLKALFTKQAVFLSDARVIGSYLPQIQIGKEFVQASLLLSAAAFYIPLLYVAERISHFVRLVLNPFYRLTSHQMTVAQMLSFMVLCVPVATTSVWLFYNKTFQESFATVLGFLALFAVFAIAQGRR